MPTEVIMPKVAAEMEKGTLARWLKKEGDQVERGEVIAEVETDKATMQVESFVSGRIAEIRRREGETVAVGDVIALVEEDGERVGAQPAERPRTEAEGEAGPERRYEKARLEVKAAKRPEEAARPRPEERPEPEREFERARRPELPEAEELRDSPAARRLARELGIDLSRVRGSGPGGRITTEDIERHATAQPAETVEPPRAAPPPEEAAERLVRPSRFRQATARRMTQSKQTIPHFYVTVQVETDQALRLRRSLKMDGNAQAVGLNDLIIKACALALKKHPEVNASWEEDGIRLHDRINIAIAVNLDQGLVAPVIKDCEKLSLFEIAAGARRLIEKARAARLSPEEISEGTFTISNMGMLGVENFIAIINPPQAAILAASAVLDTPVVRDGRIEAARIMKLTLSADHRVIDGAQAAAFLNEVKSLLENPARLLL